MFVSNLLRAFIVTAKNKSMKDSAKQLYITESPLSRRIKILEDKIGCSLFLRGRDGINLTKEGEEVYNELLPYYNHFLALEKLYLEKYKHGRVIDKKHKFNVSVEFGMIDFLSYLSYLNIECIGNIEYEYFVGDITPKLLYTDTDIILSNNDLLFDDFLVTCFSNITMDVNIVKSTGNTNARKILVSSFLSTYLDNVNIYWREKIIKKQYLEPGAELTTVPDIINYLDNVENGEAIGIFCGPVKKLILKKFPGVEVKPLTINQKDMKIMVNMYFLNKSKSTITTGFISLFVNNHV